MKKFANRIAVVLVITMMLGACGQAAPPSDSAQKKSATLYTNMSTGSPDAEFEQSQWEYSGELSPEILAEGLSSLTGLDFFITATSGADGITVNWENNSTLIANLDDRVQKEEFFFFDAESMRWFMMDSLWKTLCENLDVQNVYYTMNNGGALRFDELSPVNEFPSETPYMGSGFYFAHADVAGDGDDSARISFAIQEYTGDNIAEIPCIEYDGAGNDEIDAINHSITQGILQQYEDFMKNVAGEGPEWIEIRSYPFTTDQYLQVVVTSIIFPTYGTDGDLFSINYDRAAGKWLGVEDALTIAGLDQDALLQNVSQLFVPDMPEMVIDSVEIAGFKLVQQDDGATSVQFLLEITVDNPQAEPWKSFYSYTPLAESLVRMDSALLFDPQDLDETNPPLLGRQSNP